MSDTERMIALLRRLRTETNGAVVGVMEQRGIRYPLSYGVSFPTLRNIAREYAPNHSLALLLFEQQVRELQLAALVIDDPGQATPEQLRRWSRSFVNAEIVEQAALWHLSRTPCALSMAREWIGSEELLLRYAGILTAMRVVRRMAAGSGDDTIPEDGCAEGQNGKIEARIRALFGLLQESIALRVPDPLTVGGMIPLLCALGCLSDGWKRDIDRYAGELLLSPEPLYRHLGNEVKALLL